MKRKPSRLWLLAGLLLISGNACAEFTLEGLMAAFAGVEESESRYREEKHVAMLDFPLTSTGTLQYRRPDYLRKSTDGRRPEVVEVEGNRLRIRSSRGEREMAVDEHLRVAGFVESIRATLAGDVERLREFYELALEGSPDGWTLTLSPAVGELGRHVRQIVIQGTEAAIRRFEVQERNGDWSVMEIAGS